jgi:AcrR family transcriptional regulator
MKVQKCTQTDESGVKQSSRARLRTPIPEQQRLDPAEREAIIAREAVSFFAEHGFEGQTRELAKRLRITQPLLYRYFPSKEALIERVYQEVFVVRWKRSWEKIITDRSVPLMARLTQFYREYAEVILTYEWIRLFMFAGLKDLGLNARYLKMLRERAFEKVIEEIRVEYGRPSTSELPITVLEIEMVWGLHAAIFYLGVRQFIYSMPLETDVNSIIDAKVATFLSGVRTVLPAKVRSRSRRCCLRAAMKLSKTVGLEWASAAGAERPIHFHDQEYSPFPALPRKRKYTTPV